MCPLGRGGPLVTSSKTEQTSLTPRGLYLLFSPGPGLSLGPRPQGDNGCGNRGPSHLAEVFGSDPIVITAGKLVHKRQHLVLCPDEL